MKFSIVVPLYNKAPYVIDTIKSVLDQTFSDFEVIVVDDGSTDGGAELVAAVDDSRLCVVHQANGGVSVARNKGILLARGEWVAFLDADDWIHPNYLATLLFTQQACPDADVVGTTYLSIAHTADNWPPRWPVLAELPDVEVITDLPMRWMKAPSLSASSVAVRTTRLQQMQPCFPPGESQGEDLDLWFRLNEQTPIALAHVSLVAYRTAVQDSLTSQHEMLKLPPFLQRMQSRALSGAMSSQQRRSALWFIAQQKVSFARQAMTSGNRIESFQWLIWGRYAASGKRWWLTAAMVCFCPKSLVKNWDLWRVRRSLHPIPSASTDTGQ